MDVLVVMGAGVRPGGEPSGALRRRVAAALENARGRPDALFLVTGGVGRHPPAEALVMRRLLREAGVPDECILVDDESADTLASLLCSARMLRGLEGFGAALVCTDRYHVWRCRLLLALQGIPTRAAKLPSGRAANGWPRWLSYYLREAAAIPVDCLLLLARRLRGPL